MDSGRSKAGPAMGAVLVLAWFLLCPAAASAHTLYVFVQRIEGATIYGRAYFSGDVPAQKSDVIVRDASGRELGRTTTDDNGNFTFTTRTRSDHYLVAETPDGHSSRPYIVHASALPDGLPAEAPPGDGDSRVASQANGRADAPVASANKEYEPTAVVVQLAELRSQIELLRDEVRISDERFRFRDFLGGIGFIVGLAGVAFYMKARGRRA